MPWLVRLQAQYGAGPTSAGGYLLPDGWSGGCRLSSSWLPIWATLLMRWPEAHLCAQYNISLVEATSLKCPHKEILIPDNPGLGSAP